MGSLSPAIVVGAAKGSLLTMRKTVESNRMHTIRIPCGSPPKAVFMPTPGDNDAIAADYIAE